MPCRVLYVGTFSKVLFPSLRLGYVVVPRALRRAFRAAKSLSDTGTSALEQAALAQFIREGYHCSAPPRDAGLVLGYASLTERSIREGIRRLARVIPQVG